jgi:outer membrane protein OmpA-like peptidoglycan-associated protein
MKPSSHFAPFHRFIALLLLVLGVLSGCVTQRKPEAVDAPVTLKEAIVKGLERLLPTAQDKRTIGSPLTQWFPQTVEIAPVVDGDNNQQTVTGMALRGQIAESVKANFNAYKVQSFTDLNSKAAELRINTRLTAVRTPDGSRVKDRYNVQMNLVDLGNGAVLSQTVIPVLDESIDITPTAFYRDSPIVLAKPEPEKSPAAGPAPLIPDRDMQAGTLDEADTLYEQGQSQQALALYRRAQAQAGPNAMRAQIGEYISLRKLGREQEATAAFSGIVKLGLESRSMGVKLLFAPGKTEYWPDPAISAPYPGWIAEIAKQSAAGAHCLHVVGHTSRTGSEAFNLQLSLQRAQTLEQQLVMNQRGLGGKVETSGVGWQENLVGTGTDDLRDAIDRRVEFKVVQCAK